MYSEEGYRAVRTGAAVVRRGDRGLLAVTGPDRLVWLQGLLTNEVADLAPGAVRDAAYLTPQGRMISDVRVLHLADRTLLDVPASLSESLRAKLDGLLFAEDAQIVDISKQATLIEVHGPAASDVLARSRAALVDLLIEARDDAYGVPGYALALDSRATAGAIQTLVVAGATEISLETLDVVRVEAGRPAFLVDMDEQTIPLEAGIEDRAISFTKGCYVGQEVIVRVMHRGHGRVAKKLTGLQLEKSAIAHSGDRVVIDSREIGRATSVVWSPALQQPIALAYLHRDFLAPGTRVSVMTSDGPRCAVVTSIPFVEASRAAVI